MGDHAAAQAAVPEHFERSGYRITYVTSTAQFGRYHASLRALLQLCVNTDPAASSIGFRAPLPDADAYWSESVAAKLDVPPADKPIHLFVVTACAVLTLEHALF
jgi:hypothetical protein